MTSRLVVNNIDNDTGVTTIRLNPGYSSFEINSAERLRITSAGLVGIGTNNPESGQFQVIGSGYHQINISGNKTANANKTGGLSFLNYEGSRTSVFQTYASNSSNTIYYGSADSSARGVQYHNFYVNASRTATTNHQLALRINSSKYVGINTNSPQRSLHVVGTGRPVEIGSDNATNIVKLYASTTGRATYNGLDIIVNSTNGSSLAAYGGYLEFKTSASNGSDATSRLKITSSGNANINKNLGIQTSSVEGSELVGAGTSFFGAYIGDGMLAFHNRLDNSAGYYVAAHVNALNAGPVTLGSTMTLDGTWVIV